jgi:hypothetical protein
MFQILICYTIVETKFRLLVDGSDIGIYLISLTLIAKLTEDNEAVYCRCDNQNQSKREMKTIYDDIHEHDELISCPLKNEQSDASVVQGIHSLTVQSDHLFAQSQQEENMEKLYVVQTQKKSTIHIHADHFHLIKDPSNSRPILCREIQNDQR